jgi:hypothetical protein
MGDQGRPTQYKESYCKLLEEHLASGLTFRSFAGVIGVHFDTLYEWVKKHENFADAKKRGTAKGYLVWDKISLSIATGRSMKYSDSNGKTYNIKPKEIPPAIYIFNMKNRFGWNDRIKIKKENNKDEVANDSIIVNLNIPDNGRD